MVIKEKVCSSSKSSSSLSLFALLENLTSLSSHSAKKRKKKVMLETTSTEQCRLLGGSKLKEKKVVKQSDCSQLHTTGEMCNKHPYKPSSVLTDKIKV